MFIVTNTPLSSGCRIRVELVDRERGFMMEGVVAHARKMSPVLARLNQSGMGVRFLTVEELVRELIPSGLGETEEIPRDDAPTEPMPEPLIPPPPLRLRRPLPRPRPDRPAVPVATSGGSYTVRFSGVEEFLEVYRRDILQGGSSFRRSTPRGSRRR